MKRTIHCMLASAIGLSALTLSAPLSHSADAPDSAHKEAHEKSATATVQGAGEMKDKITGTIKFVEVEGGVKVSGVVKGLTPGKHGFHVHEKGDLSDPALKSAGGHFNPGKHKHGGPEAEEHHAGDWGNITADEKGEAKIVGMFKGVTLNGKEDGIVGRSVIIHAKEDDMKTDPAGNAGDRIAGAAIKDGK